MVNLALKPKFAKATFLPTDDERDRHADRE